MSDILLVLKQLLKSQSPLISLTCDQSADGKSDAEKILREKYPKFQLNFDVWHKVYPFTKNWKLFVNKRVKKRGELKYPWLKHLHDEGNN